MTGCTHTQLWISWILFFQIEWSWFDFPLINHPLSNHNDVISTKECSADNLQTLSSTNKLFPLSPPKHPAPNLALWTMLTLLSLFAKWKRYVQTSERCSLRLWHGQPDQANYVTNLKKIVADVFFMFHQFVWYHGRQYKCLFLPVTWFKSSGTYLDGWSLAWLSFPSYFYSFSTYFAVILYSCFEVTGGQNMQTNSRAIWALNMKNVRAFYVRTVISFNILNYISMQVSTTYPSAQNIFT